MKHTGFTLLETLVALFILSIAITGAFAVISYNLSSANSIKNGFIASGLAQEGMEVVRNVRDSDWFASRPFGSFGNAAPVADGTYCVQWKSVTLANCGNPTLLKDASGLYNYDAGTPSLFSRTVTTTKLSAVEIKVVVDVSWNDHRITKHVYAEEHLFNWY